MNCTISVAESSQTATIALRSLLDELAICGEMASSSESDCLNLVKQKIKKEVESDYLLRNLKKCC